MVTAITWKLHGVVYRLDFDDHQEAAYHAAWLVGHGREDVTLFEPLAAEQAAHDRILSRLKAQAAGW